LIAALKALRHPKPVDEVERMTAKKTNTGSGKIHLKWVRSAICAPVKQKLVIKGLGFTRLNQVIERPDNAAIRGMVAKVPHMVEFLD
jgi:large subunit ribosomal protein L30